jgi:uncharacterized membrane protein
MGKKLVLALFDTEAAASGAANALIAWYEENRIPMDAIGVLSEDDKGKVKTHLVGARKTAGGAILLGVAALLTGGMAIGLGVIGGSIVGAGFGAMLHKGLKLSKEDGERLKAELAGGKAAVGVMAEEYDTDGLVAELTALGGQVESFEVSQEAVVEAQAAADAAPAEPATEADAPAAETPAA